MLFPGLFLISRSSKNVFCEKLLTWFNAIWGQSWRLTYFFFFFFYHSRARRVCCSCLSKHRLCAVGTTAALRHPAVRTYSVQSWLSTVSVPLIWVQLVQFRSAGVCRGWLCKMTDYLMRSDKPSAGVQSAMITAQRRHSTGNATTLIRKLDTNGSLFTYSCVCR